MIPTSVDERMRSQRGEVLREDRAAAVAELARIGVPEDSQFGRFFLQYEVSSVLSSSSNEELMALVSPSPQIRKVTEFVREVYGVSARFVCLTSAEGEGFYLYDKETEAVFDIGVEGIEGVAAGMIAPRWEDFFTFIIWFLGPVPTGAK